MIPFPGLRIRLEICNKKGGAISDPALFFENLIYLFVIANSGEPTSEEGLFTSDQLRSPNHHQSRDQYESRGIDDKRRRSIPEADFIAGQKIPQSKSANSKGAGAGYPAAHFLGRPYQE